MLIELKICRYLMIIMLFVFLANIGIAADSQAPEIDLPVIDPIEKEANNLVKEIYQHFSQSDFDFVYQQLHPVLQEEITLEEYQQAQEESFQKYQVEISGVLLKQFSVLQDVPQWMKNYLFTEDNQQLLDSLIAVTINYQMSFKGAGQRQERVVEKKVYLCLWQDELYLLWNPSIIKQGG